MSLGDISRMQDRYAEATGFFQRALPIYRQVGNRLSEANSLLHLGDVALQQTRYSEAGKLYQEALPIFSRVGSRVGTGNLTVHAGDKVDDVVALAGSIELEPGACYVAVAALERGHAHGLGLRVSVGASESVDERGTNEDASAVAFCAEDRDRGRVEVEARSTGVSWGGYLTCIASSLDPRFAFAAPVYGCGALRRDGRPR